MTFQLKEEVVPRGECGTGRGRDARLKATREFRPKLDPDQLVRERRIDEASVDVEVAWEARAQAEQAVVDAEIAAGAAIERLLSERLAVTDVVHLTGLDPATYVACVSSVPTATIETGPAAAA